MVEGDVIAQRYRLGRKLGEGGMGAVYEAEHVRTKMRVAVKVLEHRASLPPETVERFLLEAQAPARIDHPNIVKVFDAEQDAAGNAFIVMELLEGETLEAVIRRDRVVQPGLLATIMDQLLACLDVMHARGFVHRDLKPANIFLATTPSEPARVKLLDFGIAKALGEDSRTHSGYVMGTPAYMAPEQMRNAKLATPRSDLWSVGVILYEALAGHRPFRGETFGLLAQIAGPSPSPSLSQITPDVSDEVAAMVASLLNKDPSGRPATAGQVRTHLVPMLARSGPVHPVDPPDDADTVLDFAQANTHSPAHAQGHGRGDAPVSREAPSPPWSEGARAQNTVGARPNASFESGRVEYAEPVAHRDGPDRKLMIAAAIAAVLAIGGAVALAVSDRQGASARTNTGTGGNGANTPVTKIRNGTGGSAQGEPIRSKPELAEFLHRWHGTVAGSQGRSSVSAFYAPETQFRASGALASPAAIQRYWTTLFSNGGSFAIDWDRSTVQEESADLNSGVAAACINLVGATGRVLKVRAWATEVVADRSADIGCPRLEGVYLVRARRVQGALQICHETWSLREGVCASCPTAPACR